MPILDNGEPLTINHCPECDSRRKLLYQSSLRSDIDFEVRCKGCGWKGSREELRKEIKTF